MYDDEEKKKKNEDNLEKNYLLELSDYAKVLDTPEGRRVIARIMEQTDPLKGGYNQDVYKMYYDIGQRDIGKYILNKCINANHKKYYQGIKEYKQFKKNNE